MERRYGDFLSIIDVVESSEDGTIIIPNAITEKLGITSGTRFAVLAEKDTLIFKKIEGPSKKEFERLVDKGTRIAKENKMKEEDIEKTIHKYRGVSFV
jgi:bifunctional DNA-binding transcriptional regulator/antitoxin component of YhaV-PrlF toxin-antitoxin module